MYLSHSVEKTRNKLKSNIIYSYNYSYSYNYYLFQS